MTDEEIQTLESVANTLRGMSMDPRIPADAREVLHEQAARLDAIVKDYLDEVSG